jgi:ribose 5-phosphate isomerase
LWTFEAAADLVENGMTVGLGTGSTVAFLLPALAHRALDIRGAATSPRQDVRKWIQVAIGKELVCAR